MVIDYRDARRADAARRVLAGAGIAVGYALEKLAPASDDPVATLLLVHRVTVGDADAPAAVAVLDANGLLPAPRPEVPPANQ